MLFNFNESLKTFDAGMAAAEDASKAGELSEVMVNAHPSPEVIAQLMMQALTPNAIIDKVYWVKVAEYMGTDYIYALKRAASFMAKVDQF